MAKKKKKKDVAPGIPGIQVENPAGRARKNPPGEGLNNPPGRGPANPPGACPEGFVWDAATKRCVVRKGTPNRPRKQGCPEGYYWDAEAKRCRKLAADPGGCPEGFVWDARGRQCVPTKTCPEGMVFKDGKCQFPDQGYCPDGYHLDANGQCVRNDQGDCPQGYVWDASQGRCVIDETAAEEEEVEVPEGAPPAPNCPEGFVAEWDDDSSTWSCVADEDAVDLAAQADLRAELRDILDQFGLATQANIELIERAVREDWSPTKFTQELRQSPDYLANPLFAANLERARAGNRFQTEGEIITYASQSRRLAKNFGYQEPSDAYIAEGIRSGLSLAEQQHRYTTQDRVNQFGAGVALVYREILGRDPSDQDLYEIFDPEISTDEIDDALRQAEYRGRPFTLGLGIRTEAEARALEMLGVNPEEAFSRYQGVAQNAPRFERLRAIEDMIAQGLPDDFGSHLMTAENGLLIRALVFQDQAALAQLQDITAREVARFKSGGTPVGTQGQLVGLLNPEQRASFG